ncbi:MAG: hypothetical protein D4R57_00835 [Verrucomicrobiales bacterium]|nr:MAG: hypothetical protein D4R57_00835 [Verrucomicrobiales bacterium]
MERIEQELSRNRHVRNQVERASELCGHPQSEKINAIMAYFDIILEHHDAIGVLIERNLIGSSFALVRPLEETFYRALWVNVCATPSQISQLLRDDTFKFPTDMMEKIDTACATQDFFQELKRGGWSSMCSYAHSGQLQIIHRLGNDGGVGPNYSEDAVIEVLRRTTTVLLFAAISFFRSVGCNSEASEMEKLALDYSKPT